MNFKFKCRFKRKLYLGMLDQITLLSDSIEFLVPMCKHFLIISGLVDICLISSIVCKTKYAIPSVRWLCSYCSHFALSFWYFHQLYSLLRITHAWISHSLKKDVNILSQRLIFRSTTYPSLEYRIRGKSDRRIRWPTKTVGRLSFSRVGGHSSHALFQIWRALLENV